MCSKILKHTTERVDIQWQATVTNFEALLSCELLYNYGRK